MRREMVMKIENMNIPPRPYKWSVLLPARSINIMETSVIPTIMAPIPIDANLAWPIESPAHEKSVVEK